MTTTETMTSATVALDGSRYTITFAPRAGSDGRPLYGRSTLSGYGGRADLERTVAEKIADGAVIADGATLTDWTTADPDTAFRLIVAGPMHDPALPARSCRTLTLPDAMPAAVIAGNYLGATGVAAVVAATDPDRPAGVIPWPLDPDAPYGGARSLDEVSTDVHGELARAVGATVTPLADL